MGSATPSLEFSLNDIERSSLMQNFYINLGSRHWPFVETISRTCTRVPKTTTSAFCESVHPVHSQGREQLLNSAHAEIVY